MEADSLRQLALSVTRKYAYNYEDAVDLAQDTLISAVSSSSWGNLDSQPAYVRKVAHRKGLTYRRVKGGRYGSQEYAKIIQSEDTNVIYKDTKKQHVLEDTEEGYDETEVEIILEALSPQDQTIIKLLMNGYEHNEVAQMMGIHRSTLLRIMTRIKEQDVMSLRYN